MRVNGGVPRVRHLRTLGGEGWSCYTQRKMTPAPQTQDLERKKLLITLTTAKLAKLEDALELNWVAHLILAGIGFALVYGIADLPKLITGYFTKGDYSQKGVAAIILAILLYYFMKLGHLLSAYMHTSDLQIALIGDFTGPETLPLRTSTSFTVQAFSDESYRNNSFWSYLLVTTAVVTLAQASAVYLVVQAYATNVWLPVIAFVFGTALIGGYMRWVKSGDRSLLYPLVIVWGGGLATPLFLGIRGYGWPPVAQLSAEAILLTLYLLFWSSQRKRRQATWVVLASLLMTCGWLTLFAVTRY